MDTFLMSLEIWLAMFGLFLLGMAIGDIAGRAFNWLTRKHKSRYKR